MTLNHSPSLPIHAETLTFLLCISWQALAFVQMQKDFGGNDGIKADKKKPGKNLT